MHRETSQTNRLSPSSARFLLRWPFSVALTAGLLAVPGIGWAFGQTKIDASLPLAPVTNRRVLFLFPGYETDFR